MALEGGRGGESQSRRGAIWCVSHPRPPIAQPGSCGIADQGVHPHRPGHEAFPPGMQRVFPCSPSSSRSVRSPSSSRPFTLLDFSVIPLFTGFSASLHSSSLLQRHQVHSYHHRPPGPSALPAPGTTRCTHGSISSSFPFIPWAPDSAPRGGFSSCVASASFLLVSDFSDFVDRFSETKDHFRPPLFPPPFPPPHTT